MAHSLAHMVGALRSAGVEVTGVGPLRASAEQAVGKIADIGCRLVLRRRYMYFHSARVARRFGHEGTRKLAALASQCEVVLSGGAVDVAYLRTDLPIVLALDATVVALRDYYPAYSHLVGPSIRELIATERLATRRAALLLYSSTWAARSALEAYGVDPAKVHVIPFGANLEHPPAAADLARRRRGKPCRLLFLAVEWERKGGDIAVDTLRALGGLGVEAELIICGCTPPVPIDDPRIRVIPFLDKQDPQQRAEFESLLMDCDFLLLPTRGDCTPNAISEANAFGLPAVTTDTGGVPEMVIDGETGFLLPLEAGGDAYAAVIARAVATWERCEVLSRNARAHYEQRLNWDAWARSAIPLISAVAGAPRPRAAEFPTQPTHGRGTSVAQSQAASAAHG